MDMDQYRTRVTSSVWQGISQSGVDLSQFPAEKQAKMVESISDQVLLTFNDLLDDTPQAKIAINDMKDEETELWQGRPFLSLVEKYAITNERLIVSTGLLGKDYEHYELIRIQDIDIKQNLGERILNLGDIEITGADPSSPKVSLRNIKQPQEVYELLRKAWLAARRKYGLLFREEM